MTCPDRLEGLRQLPASLPFLVIVGEQDKAFVEPSQRMAAAVGHGRLEVIAEAGHIPQFENPDAWWQTLSAYLAAI
jgi:3-oxoadipate enol-lactonase